MQAADLILFVVDGRDGLMPIDRELARKLRKAAAPVMLVVNTVDDAKHEGAATEFAALGFSETVAVSAEHGRNIASLCERIDQVISPLAQERQAEADAAGAVGIRLCMVGRPNAGKSSLVNAILKDERTIVSDIAGTTRDAIDLPCTYRGERFTLIDTAGLRARSKRDSSVEVFSAMRTVKAVRRSDLCVLVIDLAAGITAQDRKIAQVILDEKKPCLIVLNKFDLYHPQADPKTRMRDATEHVRRELFFLRDAPFVACSAKTRQSVDAVLGQALKIRDAAQDVPTTGQLNRILQQAFEANPPPLDRKLKRRLKLYYATAAINERYSVVPVPTLVLFVNDKRLLTASYESYLVNCFREGRPAPGIPVILSVRSRQRREWIGGKQDEKAER
jgi:GTP-binding protein